jgi:hypothetical protein
MLLESSLVIVVVNKSFMGSKSAVEALLAFRGVMVGDLEGVSKSILPQSPGNEGVALGLPKVGKPV